MNHSLIAVRYAKALFKLVKERNLLDAVNRDLMRVDQIVTGSKDFSRFLLSPLYKPSQKKDIFLQLIQGTSQPVTLQFLNLVIDKRREGMLRSIIRNYGDLYRNDQKIKRVVFTGATTYSLSFESNLKAELEELLHSRVELTIREKKELIGGFVLIVDGKLADASISNRLKQLQKRLLN